MVLRNYFRSEKLLPMLAETHTAIRAFAERSEKSADSKDSEDIQEAQRQSKLINF